MINLTVEQAYAILPAVQELMGTRLPVKAALKVMKFALQANTVFTTYQSRRNVLLMELGVKDEAGELSVPEEKQQEFYNKLKEVVPEGLAVEAEGITMAELGEEAQISPAALLTLKQHNILLD